MKKIVFLALLTVLILSNFASARNTTLGIGLVLEYATNNTLVSGSHNLTVTISGQDSCATGIFYNTTFTNGITNGRSNVTITNLNTTYLDDYYICYSIDGTLLTGRDRFSGLGNITSSDIQSGAVSNVAIQANAINQSQIISWNWSRGQGIPANCSAGQFVTGFDNLSSYCSTPAGNADNVTGSGTANRVAKWSNGTYLINSNIIDNGTLITLNTTTTVNGNLSADWFTGLVDFANSITGVVNKITSAMLQTGSVTNEKISTLAVNATQIIFGSVNASHIVADSINSSHLQNGAVTNAKIDFGAVNNSQIQNNVINSSQIQNGAVTNSKIDFGAVNNSQVQNNAVNHSQVISVNWSRIYYTPSNCSVGQFLTGFDNLSRYCSTPASSSTANTSFNTIVNGRLTLTANTPVTTADVTNANYLYFTPYKGNNIVLYNGSDWVTYSFGEINYTVPGTASKVYDVFAYYNGSGVTINTTAWTNNNTRATALIKLNGVYVKTGATGHKYIGTIMTGAAGQTTDSIIRRWVWNYYNRIQRNLYANDTTASWTYSTVAWRAANNDVTNSIDLVTGISEDAIRVRVRSGHSRNNASDSINDVGIGLDSTTVNSAQMFGNAVYTINEWTSPDAEYVNTVSIGAHTFYWIEEVSQGTSTTFNNVYAQGGIIGEIYG